MLGILAGMNQKDRFALIVVPFRGAEASSHGPACSLDHRVSPVAREQGVLVPVLQVLQVSQVAPAVLGQVVVLVWWRFHRSSSWTRLWCFIGAVVKKVHTVWRYRSCSSSTRSSSPLSWRRVCPPWFGRPWRFCCCTLVFDVPVALVVQPPGGGPDVQKTVVFTVAVLSRR